MVDADLLPLVGRSDVLAEVAAVLDRARAGRGTLALVSGEPGVGKTRLTEEAAARAQGLRLVWSWCGSEPTASSFRPWARIVRELCAAHASVARMVTGSQYLRALVAGDPGVGATEAHPELARLQLFDAVVDAVRTAATREPLLIVMDDLHDAHESTLWLLAHLAPALRASHAVVLATARERQSAWHGHVEALATLVRQARSFSLGPLDGGEVAGLVTHLTGTRPDPELVGSIMARTGGNALLVTELLRLLGARGIADSAAVTQAVPASVQATAAEQLRAFGFACRRLLSAAAVLGTRFRLDVLGEIGSVGLADVRLQLAEAEVAGLVMIRDPGEGRFVHELLRDAAYETLSPRERETWHKRAGKVLTGLAERGRDVNPAEVAHHLLQAGPGAAATAAAFAQQAGDDATRLLAYEDAAQWYEQAMAALKLVDAGATQRGALLLSLSEARLGCGDRDGARAGFLAAAEVARGAGLPDILARAALGLGSGAAGFEVGLFDREQLDLLREARLALSENDRSLRALVTARLSVAATSVEPEGRRLELARGAVRLARQAEDDAAVAYTLAALCDALAGPEHHRARLDYATEIVGLSTRLRDAPLELLGRRLRVVALLEAGDRTAAEAETRAFGLCAERLHHPLYLWYLPLWRGMWALAEGRFADCRTHNSEAEVLGRKAGSDNAFLLTATQHWCLLAEMEDRPHLQEMLSSIDVEQLGGLWALIGKALVVAQLGRTEEARRRLDAVAPQLGSLPRDSEWLATLAQVAETIGRIGSHPVASWVYDSLRTHADLFVVEGIGAAIRGPVHRHLGLLATALGDSGAAQAHFEAGVAAAAGFGAPQLVERIRGESASVVPREVGGTQVSGDAAFSRSGELWTLRFAGREAQLRDSKGLRDLAVLLARPGQHVAALDLMTAVGPSRGPLVDASGLDRPGDTGELLDTTARDAYRRRLGELESDADDADARGDAGRAALIAAERDALIEQLSAAYGLGGRVRRAGSAAERARTAVTARIRDALRRVNGVHPRLGRHLQVSVRTGAFCSYEPEDRVDWQL